MRPHLIPPFCAQSGVTKVEVPISCLGILHICNLWILLRKIVMYFVGRKVYLRWLFAAKFNGSDVNAGICFVTPGCFNVQMSHMMNLRISVYFHQIVTYSVQNQVIYFLYIYNCVFSHVTCLSVCLSTQIPGLTSFPLPLRAKKSTKIEFSTHKIYYNFSK